MTRTRTTRYVILLSVVLALAFTVVLAACGSDEPSGVTGPDRTASTPGSGDAPTATDAAATAPPAASGSVEMDREALVALYNAMGLEKWVSDAPLSGWGGVSTNDDGRVRSLDLSDIELRGEIPAELGSLSNLENLDLSFNDLSGEIPAELGSLSKLQQLRLDFNDLSGEIPPELGSLSNLTKLDLYDNDDLSGCVPSSLDDQMGASAIEIGLLSFC